MEITTLDALREAMALPRSVIDFGRRNGCIPCQRLDPHFKAAAKSNVLSDIAFFQVMLDEVPADLFDYCMNTLNILGTPTVIEFRNGERYGDVIGRTAPVLIKELSQ